MFDFAWSEIALIGVVALVAIGPKDMPVAIKTIADLVKKGRRMAGEFQVHVDEMVREANLHEVRDQFKDLRSLNIRDQIARAVDGDGSLRRTLSEDPLRDPARPGTAPAPASRAGADAAGAGVEHPAGENSIGLPRLPAAAAPAFLPPGTEAPEAALSDRTAQHAAAVQASAPSFIPPGAVMPQLSAAGLAAPGPRAPEPAAAGAVPSAAGPSVAGVAPAGPPAPQGQA